MSAPPEFAPQMLEAPPVPLMWDPDAERGLVGAVLINAQEVLEDPEVAQVRPEDFHDLALGRYWRIVRELHDKGQPVTVELVALVLQGLDQAPVAPIGQLCDLAIHCPTTLAAPRFTQTVRKDALRRALHQAASEIAVLASDGKDADSYKLLGQAARVIEKVSGSVPTADDKLWTAAAICDLTLGGDDWLLPGHIPSGGLVLIAGDVGGGKSWLGLDIGLAAASGGSVMGATFPEPVPCLYLGPDNSWRTMVARIQGLCAGREIPGPGQFYLSDEAINLIEPGGADRLRRLVKQTDARLVVLDVFARFAQGIDENAAGEVAPVLTALRGVANATGAAFILLHHLNKQGVVGSIRSWLQAIRGSVEIAGCVDVAYILTAKGEYEQAERALKQTKNRDAKEAQPMTFGIQPGASGGIVLTWDAAPIHVDHNLAEETADLMAGALREAAGVGQTMTRADLEKWLQEHNALPGRTQVTKALDALRRKPGVTITKHGKEITYAAICA